MYMPCLLRGVVPVLIGSYMTLNKGVSVAWQVDHDARGTAFGQNRNSA